MYIYHSSQECVYIWSLYYARPLSRLPEIKHNYFSETFLVIWAETASSAKSLASGSDYEEITQKTRRTMWEHVNFQALSVGVDVFSILEKHCTPQFIPLFVTFLIPKSNITGH